MQKKVDQGLDKIKEIKDKGKNKELTDKEKKTSDDKLRLLELQGQGLLNGTKAYFENRKAVLDESMNKELIGVEKGSAEEQAIRKKYTQLGKQDRLYPRTSLQL